MERVVKGRVVERLPIIPAARQSPRVGDVVVVADGKFAGRVGRVAGKLDPGYGMAVRWNVMRDDGVMIGSFPTHRLTIVAEGS